MAIDGIGEQLIHVLVENSWVKDVADLYQISTLQWLSLPRMAKKSVENITEALKKSKSTSFARVIYALGIREIGEVGAKTLAHHYKNFDELKNASIEELLTLPDFGPVAADAIHQSFRNPHFLQICQKLMDAGVQWPLETKQDAQTFSPLTNKTVVGENPGSKYQKALDLGIRILNEDELIEILGSTSNE